MTITQDVDLREPEYPVTESRKATIVQIGVVIDGQPVGFVLDCRGTIPGVEIKDGVVLHGGYTVGELSEMASR